MIFASYAAAKRPFSHTYNGRTIPETVYDVHGRLQNCRSFIDSVSACWLFVRTFREENDGNMCGIFRKRSDKKIIPFRRLLMRTYCEPGAFNCRYHPYTTL